MSMDVIPVERLTRASDRFVCKLYACTLTAASCGARQARARAASTVTEKLATRHCRACPDADRVLELSGAVAVLPERSKAPPVPPRARRSEAPATVSPPPATAAEMQREALANRAAERPAAPEPSIPALAPPPAVRMCAWPGPPTCSARAAPVNPRTPAAVADYCHVHRIRVRRMQLLAARELERTVAAVADADASEPTTRAPPQAPRATTCRHPDGCLEPVPRVRADTHPDREAWCARHRKSAQESALRQKRSATASETPVAVAPPAPPATPPRASERVDAIVDAERITAAHAYLVRALDVIDKLGGIDRAEKLAAALGVT
jgi:hypothetical protein